MLVLGAFLAYYITTLNPLVSENSSSLYILFAGAIAICAMILPGISGSFILVLLGAYKPVLEAVNDRDFKTIITFMIGAIVGLLSFSKVLKWLFNNYKNITLAALTGFIIGSLNKIWPWKLTELVFDKSSGKIIPFSEVSDLGNLSQYQLQTNDYETYKIALEQSVSPFSFDGEAQLTFAIILAVVGFGLILLMEKIAAHKN